MTAAMKDRAGLVIFLLFIGTSFLLFSFLTVQEKAKTAQQKKAAMREHNCLRSARALPAARIIFFPFG
jgi:Na+/melibiose symporter-like transporter